MAQPVFVASLNQFIIKELLLQICRFHADFHRVAEVIDDAGTLAHDAVMFLIELEEIGLDIVECDHSFNLGRLDFHVHSPFGKTGDMAIVLAADLILHKFHELVFRAGPFCLSSNHFSLRSMFTLVLVICLALRIRTIEIHLQKPVHHGIRITADRRCEMRVELEAQTIMADIVSAVTCLRH